MAADAASQERAVAGGRLPRGVVAMAKAGSRLARFVLVAVLAAIIITALAIGMHTHTPRNFPARVQAIASKLRCPSCVDESAEQADTPAARSIRFDIAARLRDGQSERQIVSYMVSRYGKWILLSPPASGIDLAVWVLPAGASLAALGVVAVAFSRSARRRGGELLTDEDRQRVAAALASYEEVGPPEATAPLSASGRLHDVPPR